MPAFAPNAWSPSPASATNTYVWNAEATGRLLVNFSKNKDSFSLPRYTTLTKTKNTAGYYTEIDPDNAARIVSQNHYTWADGAPMPNVYAENQMEFQRQPFLTTRYVFTDYLGDLAKEQ